MKGIFEYTQLSKILRFIVSGGLLSGLGLQNRTPHVNDELLVLQSKLVDFKLILSYNLCL